MKNYNEVKSKINTRPTLKRTYSADEVCVCVFGFSAFVFTILDVMHFVVIRKPIGFTIIPLSLFCVQSVCVELRWLPWIAVLYLLYFMHMFLSVLVFFIVVLIDVLAVVGECIICIDSNNSAQQNGQRCVCLCCWISCVLF